MDGETIGYRMIRPTIANEEDRAKRERLEEARNRLTEEHINPIHIDGIAIVRRAVPRLGRRPTPTCTAASASGSTSSPTSAARVLESTETLYERDGGQAVPRRVGVGLDDAERWDVARSFRAPAGTRPSPPRR